MSTAFERGAEAARREDYKLAEQAFLEVLRDEPENARAMINLVFARVHRRRSFRSLKLLRRAIQLAPEDVEILRVAAQIQFIVRNVKAGIATLTRARALDPDNATIHAIMASAYLGLRKRKECEFSLKQALRLQPHNGIALRVKTNFERVYFNAATAEQTARGRLRKAPESASAHISVGEACLAKGDVDQAYWHFREALRLSPNSVEARNALLSALRQRFPIYNWMYRLQLRTARYRVSSLILTAFVGVRIIAVLQSNHDLPPAVQRVAIIVGCIVLATFALILLPMPIVNLVVRFHPVGRYAMTKLDKAEIVFAGTLFVVGIGQLAFGLGLHEDGLLIWAFITGCFFLLEALCMTWTQTKDVRIFLFWLLSVLWSAMQIIGLVSLTHPDLRPT